MFFYELYSNLPYQNVILLPLMDVVQLAESIQQRNINSQPIQQQVTNSEKQISIEIFQKELIKKHKESKSKLWTQQEDALLYQLVNSQHNWIEISEKLEGKCELVCQRRYNRLIKQNERWPKENEKKIKYLYEERKMSWGQIQKVLPKYTKKQIKQRYKNFLEVDIKRAPWTVAQDLQLWCLVKKYGNSWVQFTKILAGRSQLQLKNRYNKFIKRLEMRLLSEGRIDSQIKSLENNLDQ